MQEPSLIMAKVEDAQSRAQLSLPILCTFEEHYSGEAAQKAKQMAMGILKSRAAFTHVSFEPLDRPDLADRSKMALIHQRIYNPHQAEFRGYTELEIEGYRIKYALRTSGFCSYAVVETPATVATENVNGIEQIQRHLRAAS